MYIPCMLKYYSEFYKTVKSRVYKYLKENNIVSLSIYIFAGNFKALLVEMINYELVSESR